MLNNDDVDGARHLADLCDRTFGFRRAHTACRLIEQQQLRVGDERHPDLEQRHIAVRQSARLPPRKSCQPDLLERSRATLARGWIGGFVTGREETAGGSTERYQEHVRDGARGGLLS